MYPARTQQRPNQRLQPTAVGRCGIMRAATAAAEPRSLGGAITLTALTRVLVVVAIVGAQAACGGSWPPVIGTADDVRALPSDTRSVRCIACGDGALGAVATRLTRLEYVFANEAATLTDRGIEALAELPSLRQVVILNANKLTDASVIALASLPSLQELTVERAPHITGEGVRRLATSKSLRRIHLAHCSGADPNTLIALRTALPQAEILASE